MYVLAAVNVAVCYRRRRRSRRELRRQLRRHTHTHIRTSSSARLLSPLLSNRISCEYAKKFQRASLPSLPLPPSHTHTWDYGEKSNWEALVLSISPSLSLILSLSFWCFRLFLLLSLSRALSLFLTLSIVAASSCPVAVFDAAIPYLPWYKCG